MTTRLRAPAEHGAILIDPPSECVADLLEQAGRFRLQYGFLDLSHSEMRDLARREALDCSAEYHRRLGEPVPENDSGPWLLAGHQPELFHPGVWLKNFVLAGLASRHRAVGLNLVVDNDTLKHSSIRVPSWDGPSTPPEHVRAATVPFDDAVGEAPYEEATIQNEEMFRRFPSRIADQTREWPETPIAAAFWKRATDQPSPSIGSRFAAARRGFEREWGAFNRELPLSWLCRSTAFARFAGAILLDLPRFHAIYNQSVRAHRKTYHIRSRNHPVPDLQVDGDWLESPFWAWQAGAARRTQLFARRIGDRLELRAGVESWPSLPVARLAAAWPELEALGRKIRTRALTTTLFARLVLADLFLHGLGGGLYDRLTDEIAAAYFGAALPAYTVVTGTLKLPLTSYAMPAGVDRRERDLIWNPQRHLAPMMVPAEVRALLSQRAALIAACPSTRRTRRQRYVELREILASLSPFVDQHRAAAHLEWKVAKIRAGANRVLSERDYSFVLHSEASLRSFLQREKWK